MDRISMKQVLQWLSIRLAFVADSIDLLDLATLFGLTLVTLGSAMIWDAGVACLVLGSLLLVMIFLGIPTPRRP